MHLYWRVIEELKYLGERWEIIDPTILRRYQSWIHRHSDTINIIFKEASIADMDYIKYCKGSASIH